MKPPPKPIASFVVAGVLVMLAAALMGIVGLVVLSGAGDAIGAGSGEDAGMRVAPFFLVSSFLGLVVGAYLISLGTPRGISRR